MWNKCYPLLQCNTNLLHYLEEKLCPALCCQNALNFKDRATKIYFKKASATHHSDLWLLHLTFDRFNFVKNGIQPT